MQRIYLDSNVFIALIDREMDRQLRGLFVEAELFLEKVKKHNDILILSDWFFREVQKICYFSKEEVLEYFEKIGIKTEAVEQKQNLSLEEFRKRGMHSQDALHAAIAVEQKCDCIVTFNAKDFEKIKDKIRVFEPLEFT